MLLNCFQIVSLTYSSCVKLTQKFEWII